SGIFWLVVSLVSLGLYYQYLLGTGAEELVLTRRSRLIFEGSVLAGLYVLVMLLSLSYERAKNMAVAELKASEEWGRTIVENAADAILTFDVDGIIYSANEACSEIFGFDEKDLRGRPFDFLVPAARRFPPAPNSADEDIPVAAAVGPLTAPVERSTALRAWSGRVIETAGVRADGRPVAVEVAIDRLILGPEEQFVVVVRDLTYRKKVEEQQKRALEESKESFRALIETLPDGLIVHRRGEIKYLNSAAGRMLRYEDSKQLIGHPISELIPAGELERFFAVADRTRDLGELGELEEHHVVTCHGDRIPVESVTFQAMFQNEKALISIVRDLTETRKMRMQMMQMERMSAVGTLAAGVAHEINNPLAYVRGNLEYVDEELRYFVEERDGRSLEEGLLEDCRDWISAVEDAHKGTERIRNIVTDLRTYSQQRDVEIKPIDVEEVIETSISMAYSGIKHRARLVRDFQRVDPVFGEAASLGQVVLNLLINATHAIPEGRVAENEIRVKLRQKRGQIIIEVSDTGTGIPDSVLPQIFDPFFTTKTAEQGTGLGLAICRNIIRTLHGDLDVRTAPGKGATFRVRIPVAKVAATATEDVVLKEEYEEVSEHKPRVLIIDDERLIREMLRRRLARKYHVEDVQRPSEAFARLERGASYDVILCDLMMPGETGIDFYGRLEREYPRLKDRVIFITGGAVTQKTADFLREHESAVLKKPFKYEELHSQIHGRLHH
ncbi:MAG: PAS domain S-box protein, partial [Bradymonadaceae bacterium]